MVIFMPKKHREKFKRTGKTQEIFFVSVATGNKSESCRHGSGESYLVSTVLHRTVFTGENIFLIQEPNKGFTFKFKWFY